MIWWLENYEDAAQSLPDSWCKFWYVQIGCSIATDLMCSFFCSWLLLQFCSYITLLLRSYILCCDLSKFIFGVANRDVARSSLSSICMVQFAARSNFDLLSCWLIWNVIPSKLLGDLALTRDELSVLDSSIEYELYVFWRHLYISDFGELVYSIDWLLLTLLKTGFFIQ